jgi:hypothetical protein
MWGELLMDLSDLSVQRAKESLCKPCALGGEVRVLAIEIMPERVLQKICLLELHDEEIPAIAAHQVEGSLAARLDCLDQSRDILLSTMVVKAGSLGRSRDIIVGHSV